MESEQGVHLELNDTPQLKALSCVNPLAHHTGHQPSHSENQAHSHSKADGQTVNTRGLIAGLLNQHVIGTFVIKSPVFNFINRRTSNLDRTSFT